MNYSASYDPQDDKLRLRASSRLPKDVYDRIRKAGFQWAPKQDLFYCVWAPVREDICLELAGEIDDEDTSLVDRAEARADRFEGYSERRGAEAESAHKAVDYIAERFSGGQPILIGHHSEKRARKDAERIENGMRKAIRLWDTSNYWTDRAASALAHAKYLERPDVRARRIKGLESDIRVYRSKFTPASKEVIMQRRWSDPNDAAPVPHVWCAPRGGRGGSWVAAQDIAGIERHYSRWIAHAENRLAYERAMLGEAGGTVADKTGPEVGGGCKCWASPRGGWAYIVKVNKVSVSLLDNWGNGGGNFRRTIPFDKLTAVMTKAEVEAKRAGGMLVDLTDGTGFALLDTPIPPARTPEAPAPEAAKFEALRDVLKAGVQVVSAPQLFPTPVPLARRMAELADIEPGMSVLEPSAGTGRILSALPNVRPGGYVVAVEINYNLAKLLEEIADDTRNCDFLECNGDLGTFDRIVMNPPFVGGADIEHITHAVKFLKPGGKLVAICAGGPRQAEKLQPLADTWEPLPAGTFEESGTGVNTVLLTIYKAREDSRTITGETLSLFPMEG